MATTTKKGHGGDGARGGGGGGGGAGERPRLRSSHNLKGKDDAQRPGKSRGPSKHGKGGAPRRARGAGGGSGGGNAPSARQEPRTAPALTAGPRMKKTRAHAAAPSSTASAGGGGTASDSARELATVIAVAALDKKAVGLEILDVAGKVDYADFLVIMTGRSDRQVQALAQGIEEAMRKKNVRPLAVEGLPHASWVLMDYGDVVVHVFQDEARSMYDIEGLWMDARRLPVPVPDDIQR